MKFKDVMGTLSPLYGMISGHGAFGKNDLGAASAIARRFRKKNTDGTESSEEETVGMRKGGRIKKYAKGGSASSASKRADGCATKGKTRGKFV